MIKNYMEILVDEVYQEMKSLLTTCETDECEHDIKVISLNNLPAVYFTSKSTEAEKKAFLLDRQRRTSVLAKMTEAAAMACGNCKEK